MGSMHDVAHFKRDQRRTQNRKLSEIIQRRNKKKSGGFNKKKHKCSWDNFGLFHKTKIQKRRELDLIAVDLSCLFDGTGMSQLGFSSLDMWVVEHRQRMKTTAAYLHERRTGIDLVDFKSKSTTASKFRLLSKLYHPDIWDMIYSYLTLAKADKCELRWQCTVFRETLPVPHNYFYARVLSLPTFPTSSFRVESLASEEVGWISWNSPNFWHRLLTLIFGSDWIANSSHGIQCTCVEWVETLHVLDGYTIEAVATRVSEWRVNPISRTFDVKFWHGVVRTGVPRKEIRFRCSNSAAAEEISIGMYSSSKPDRKFYRKNTSHSQLGLRKLATLVDLLPLAFPTGESMFRYKREYIWKQSASGIWYKEEKYRVWSLKYTVYGTVYTYSRRVYDYGHFTLR